MSQIVIYSTGACPFCIRARMFFERRNLEFEDIRIDLQPNFRMEMEQRSRRTSVPQIFIGDVHVGGYDDMVELDMDGKLDDLLNGVTNK
ncbi:MAG: glutaredoxin 3 [Gammaproteobacteria bacterium]|nr:glutaredoxin 3 [Gammaproteobacteria bacterium]MDH5728872.1 glutaredoxin 3 [Gammaproteobacteria bacterium]